jgi:hypothetical protein
MPDPQVCRRKPQSKTKLSAAIAAAWGRVSNSMGRGSFSDASDFNSVTLERALKGPSLPAAENLLNSLAADPTALEEVLDLYGLTATPKRAEAANDLALVTDMSGAVAEFLKRIADGKRCHIDEAILAELFRPIIPQMQAIVDSHDRRRGAA